MKNKKPTQIIAHRGDSVHAPENTLAAFREALRKGADGVEFDLHLAIDGIPMVIHDKTLERTTSGVGPVGARTATELRALDAGSWFDPAFSGERVPSLAEVLALLGGKEVILHLELKSSSEPQPELVAAVLAQLAAEAPSRSGLLDRVVFSSFQHGNLEILRRDAPQWPYAALVTSNDRRPLDTARKLGCAGLHPPWKDVDEAMVRSCHEAGLAIRPWVVDDPEVAARMFDWGVDGIITNDPNKLLALRRSRES